MFKRKSTIVIGAEHPRNEAARQQQHSVIIIHIIVNLIDFDIIFITITIGSIHEHASTSTLKTLFFIKKAFELVSWSCLCRLFRAY